MTYHDFDIGIPSDVLRQRKQEQKDSEQRERDLELYKESERTLKILRRITAAPVVDDEESFNKWKESLSC